jgi:hypothetical protein
VKGCCNLSSEPPEFNPVRILKYFSTIWMKFRVPWTLLNLFLEPRDSWIQDCWRFGGGRASALRPQLRFWRCSPEAFVLYLMAFIDVSELLRIMDCDLHRPLEARVYFHLGWQYYSDLRRRY